MYQTISAILFDKDGTLFDFHESWSGWAAGHIADLSAAYGVPPETIAQCLGYDLTARRFVPGSLSIAASVEDQARALAPVLGEDDTARLAHRIARSAEGAVMQAVVPLPAYLDGLRARGLHLGIATNDAEATARAQMDRAGVTDRFAYIAGYDSGHGAKPGPGMCRGFARALALDPARVVMVGDSRHDLDAGRAADMRTLAVENGLTPVADLAPLAEAVLPDIRALPAWLDAQDAAAR